MEYIYSQNESFTAGNDFDQLNWKLKLSEK